MRSRTSRAAGGLAVVLLAALSRTTGPPTAGSAPEGGTGEGSPAAGAVWRGAGPGYAWNFPQDHRAHPDFRTEWWYLTGIVADTSGSGRRYGYQLTFFRIGLSPEAPPFASDWAARGLVLAHAAVTDIEAGTHAFVDVGHREIPLLGGFPDAPDPRLAWCRAPAGTDALWELAWRDGGFEFRVVSPEVGFDLRAVPAKPVVFQGPEGVSRKGRRADAASLYYSYTRLDTRGTLRSGPERVPVAGTSWMDKEFGSNQLGPGQVGWDWFSLVFDDGRELMLYVLRKADGSVDFASGTLVDPRGVPEYLAANDWTLAGAGRWESPHTGAVYPSAWELRVPRAGIDARVRPLVADQENVPRRSRSPAYWEGAVSVTSPEGKRLGSGYVELTGYAPGARLDL